MSFMPFHGFEHSHTVIIVVLISFSARLLVTSLSDSGQFELISPLLQVILT